MLAMIVERLFVFVFFVGLASAAAVLPPDEVNSLKVIANTLGKKDWNFSVDPCSGLYGWSTQNPKEFANAVRCNCSFANNTVCHVVSIILKSQDLDGTVPRELTRLPFLQEIDLTRNYLNGTIPREWGSMPLVNISLLGNRVTGPIPDELANITTLANLTLEFNQLSGPIPPGLGSLPRIEKLLFTSNNLSGEIPVNLAKLSTLKDFRIGDNNFQGSIPNFIQNWTNINRLVIQGSGLSGPIPRGIGSLTKLTDLRISDLNGNDSAFPPLSNLKNLQYLILRRCNIIGDLPDYLSNMTGLTVLDLSFNKLSGSIPDRYIALSRVKFIYLTGNDLSGPLPSWLQNRGNNIDLSYNNLTSESENSVTSCQPGALNLFASTKGNSSGIVSCLRIRQCEKPFKTYLRINCGGRASQDDNGNTYEDDSNSGGPSIFFQSKTNWGFSSTGHSIDDYKASDSYTLQNSSSISGRNPQLYTDARRSPLSLTYYGFCMANGNYTVNLHFAEILFTGNRSYASLGRRLFDVYVQGKLALKDFNIEDEAGGVNIGITKSFNATVRDNTLDIRFYWAGKGTTGIPVKGVYGPLISAISVDSYSLTPSENNSSMSTGATALSENNNSISTGAIVGIVIGILFAVFLVLAALWWIGCFKRKDTLENELRGVDLKTGSFSLRQIKAATNNFDPANKIGEGGFGPVYKGVLSDGVVIAVKQLSSKSSQGNREFLNEIGMISAIQHPNLVKLYGCCIEDNQLMLIYEYLENNSLARALFGPEEHQLHLDWPTRHRICFGIARGLAYLHEESRLKIVHRDIKATNVLLDKNLTPKISDFGLAKLNEEDNTHISTRIAGTIGYMAPEYALRGYLTDKADVYSFGVVLLEIVSGRSNSSIKAKVDKTDLLEWANSLNLQGELLDLMDPRLESNFNKGEVITTIKVALLCTNPTGPERPSMSIVVSMLEGKYEVDFDSSSVFKMTNAERQSVSADVPWTVSSAASTNDLYPIDLDTEYWDKKID